jgi:hypothetical protein
LLSTGIAQEEEALMEAEDPAAPIAGADSGSIVVERQLSPEIPTCLVAGRCANDQTRPRRAGDLLEPKLLREYELGKLREPQQRCQQGVRMPRPHRDRATSPEL